VRLLDARGAPSELELGSVAVNLPPQWVQVSENVATVMRRIKERLLQLTALHARALLPNFDEFSGEDAKVEVLTQEITGLFKRCEKSLTALSAAHTGGDEGDAKVRQNVVRSMAAELQKLSIDFRKKQKDYLQKLKLTQDRRVRCPPPARLWLTRTPLPEAPGATSSVTSAAPAARKATTTPASRTCRFSARTR